MKFFPFKIPANFTVLFADLFVLCGKARLAENIGQEKAGQTKKKGC